MSCTCHVFMYVQKEVLHDENMLTTRLNRYIFRDLIEISSTLPMTEASLACSVQIVYLMFQTSSPTLLFLIGPISGFRTGVKRL